MLNQYTVVAIYKMKTYRVIGLLSLITFLVGLGAGLIWFTILGIECLPLLTQHFADTAYRPRQYGDLREEREETMRVYCTEADAWIILAYVVTLLVGKEHVGGEAALWGIRI